MAARHRAPRNLQPSPPLSPWRRPPSPRNVRPLLPQQIQLKLSSFAPSRSWDDGDDPVPPVHLGARHTVESRSWDEGDDPPIHFGSRGVVGSSVLDTAMWAEEIDEPPDKCATVSTPTTSDDVSWSEESKRHSPMTVSDGDSLHEETTSQHEKTILNLRNALAEATQERDRVTALNKHLQQSSQETQTKVEKLTREKEELECSLQRDYPRPPTQSSASLTKLLNEKSQALESAKLIITSLEAANGSQIADLMQKVRDKQSKIEKLESTVQERQKTIDKLAVELRDNNAAAIPRKLWTQLEHNMNEIRSASVVLEATQDAIAVLKILSILDNSIRTLKEGAKCFSGAALPSSVDSASIHQELEDREHRIRQLEVELRNQKATLDAARSAGINSGQMQALKAEVSELKKQHTNSLTLLARKERELAVLRDSLKVDDGVGYISDDEEDDVIVNTTPSVPAPIDTTSYAPSQVEALATLLAQGGCLSPASVASYVVEPSVSEVEELRTKLRHLSRAKEQAELDLRAERESLANAKMIISSLEKANKSMMEDLRSRLHYSNTAIASLLEKSVGTEKTTAQLRQDLEALRKQREDEKEKYQKEVDRLRFANWPIGRPDDEMMTETID